MKDSPNDGKRDRLGEAGAEYFTELTVEYIEDLPEADLLELQPQSDRNVIWFNYSLPQEEEWAPEESLEMSVSVYPTSPAVTVGVDTKIAFLAFQQNAAWILRTCADFGVGVDLEVEEATGETWMFLFLRLFWAGYNFEVLTQACDDLAQCRRALEARLPIEKPKRGRE